MCSMALVLFVIMAGINTANYTNVCRNADMRIHVIAENDGKFPENPADDNPQDDNQTPPEPKKKKNWPGGISLRNRLLIPAFSQ